MPRSLKSSIIADSVGSCQRHANLSIIQCDIRELWYHGSCDVLNKVEANHETPGLIARTFAVSFISLNPVHIFFYDASVGGSVINFDCS